MASSSSSGFLGKSTFRSGYTLEFYREDKKVVAILYEGDSEVDQCPLELPIDSWFYEKLSKEPTEKARIDRFLRENKVLIAPERRIERPLTTRRVVMSEEDFKSQLDKIKTTAKNLKLPKTSCFVSYSTGEEDVNSWLDHHFLPDLQRAGIRVYCTRLKGQFVGGDDLNSFETRIAIVDYIFMICTPAAYTKMINNKESGYAREWSYIEKRYQEKAKLRTIIPLVLKGKQESVPEILRQRVNPELSIDSGTSKYFSPRTVDTISKARGLLSLSECEVVAETLREVYLQNNTISLLIEEKSLPIEAIYTRLAIIGAAEQRKKKKGIEEAQLGQVDDGCPPTHESFFEPKTLIELDALFEHKKLKETPKKEVIIYGSAGIGKSTLCHYISCQWATGSLWPQFTHLFWIKLRNLNGELFPKEAGIRYTTAHLVSRECKLQLKDVQQLLTDPRVRETSLLLLDGEDELPRETSSRDRSAYLNPPFEELISLFPHILVTSRPQISSILPHTCYQLEILGFDQAGIDHYIDHFFTDNEEGKVLVRKQLNNPLAKSLAHIPIILEMFCSLAREGKPLFALGTSPTTTTIYKTLTDWLYKRFLIEKTPVATSSARSDPDPSEDPDVRKTVLILEEIAWQAMEQNTLYLSSRNITRICRKFGLRNSKPLENLGPFRIKEGLGRFIHLTFQEYFAATYLARFYTLGNVEEGRKLLTQIKFDPRYSITLPMVAGVLSLERDDGASLRTFFKDLFGKPRDLAKGREPILFSSCFAECVDPKQVPQYEGEFIPSIIEYMQAIYLPTTLFRFLKRNIRLLYHEKIINYISDCIVKPIDSMDPMRERIINLLESMAKAEQPIPIKLIKLLLESLSNRVLTEAIWMPGQLPGGMPAEIPLRFSPDILEEIPLHLLEEITTGETSLTSGRIGVLEEIATGEQAVSTMAIEDFLLMASYLDIPFFRMGLIHFLKRLSSAKQDIPIEFLEALAKKTTAIMGICRMNLPHYDKFLEEGYRHISNNLARDPRHLLEKVSDSAFADPWSRASEYTIIKELEKIDLSVLKAAIEKDPSGPLLVLQICAITQRAFWVLERTIHIADQRKHISVDVEEDNLSQLRAFSINGCLLRNDLEHRHPILLPIKKGKKRSGNFSSFILS